jgi:hypothetical protein
VTANQHLGEPRETSQPTVGDVRLNSEFQEGVVVPWGRESPLEAALTPPRLVHASPAPVAAPAQAK